MVNDTQLIFGMKVANIIDCMHHQFDATYFLPLSE